MNVVAWRERAGRALLQQALQLVPQLEARCPGITLTSTQYRPARPPMSAVVVSSTIKSTASASLELLLDDVQRDPALRGYCARRIKHYKEKDAIGASRK